MRVMSVPPLEAEEKRAVERMETRGGADETTGADDSGL